MKKLPAGESEREFHRLAAIETDDCVIWPYAKSGQRQYGCVYFPGNVKRYAHREALRIRVPQPDGTHATHGACNQPACMNYRHLSWGTPTQNNLDRLRDGTAPIGERNPMARLTATEVQEMRAIYDAGGISHRALAARFGVATMTANRAVRGESWRYVA